MKKHTWLLFLFVSAQLFATAVSFAQTRPSPASVERSTREAVSRGDARGAARAAEVSARANAKDPAPSLRAAALYETMNDTESAKRAANDALERDPRSVEALVILGRLAARERNWPAAADFFRRATAADPALQTAQLGLGEALEKSGDQAGADVAYDAYRRLRGKPPLKQ